MDSSDRLEQFASDLRETQTVVRKILDWIETQSGKPAVLVDRERAQARFDAVKSALKTPKRIG